MSFCSTAASGRSASWPLLLALGLVAACTGPATRPPADAGPRVEAGVPAAKTARKPAAAQKRAGAYYKDDGPADEIPPNLDQIPDAQPQLEPLHRFANRPYVVLGKAYQPNTSLRPHRETGIGSWYGKKFHGLKTSIGEPYDMFAMTAAHPTLAIPSYARVTNPGNGKSVVVRLTDRGPFHADRVIDLSYAAAHRLGYVDRGSTLVVVEAILPPGAGDLAPAAASAPLGQVAAARDDDLDLLVARLSRAPAVPGEEGTRAASAPTPLELPMTGDLRNVFLQLGAFASADNAESLRAHLQRELEWLGEGIRISSGGGMHRVHLGPYASRVEAERIADRIRVALGYKPTFVTR